MLKKVGGKVCQELNPANAVTVTMFARATGQDRFQQAREKREKRDNKGETNRMGWEKAGRKRGKGVFFRGGLKELSKKITQHQEATVFRGDQENA